MENTIDRKEYRRNSYSTYEKNKVPVCNKKRSIVWNQVINTLMLLLSVLLLKLFRFWNGV